MGRDLMRQEEIRALVREAYRTAEGSSRRVAEKLYAPEELELVPDVAADHALGVGNHLASAELRPGDVVLDVGAGAGIDTVLAAQRVGPQGRVLALDFLPEMLERTRAAARAAGVGNVETVEAQMEAIPLPDACVDHVISNGALNLSPRKRRVLAECARVLRADGRLTVADLTVQEEELPPEVLTHPAAWAG